MKPPVIIRIYKDDRLVEVKQFTDQQISIGSEASSAVVLQDPDIAPVHALIEERDTSYYLCDLGSQTGTFRNGEKILDTVIESGDQVKVGAYTLEFFKGVPKPKSPPPPTATPPPPPPVTTQASAAPVQPATPPPKPAAPPPKKPAAAPPKIATPPPVHAVPAPPATPPPKPAAAPPKVATPPPVVVPTPPATPPVAAPMQVPKSAPVQPQKAPAKSGKGRKTFAPPSEIKDLAEVMHPSRGNIVEVVTSWRERVLTTYHFNQHKTITIGGDESNDIVLPVFPNAKGGYPLIKLGATALVFLRLEMTGILRKENKQTFGINELLGLNRLIPQSGGLYGLHLEQAEVIRLDFPNEVSVFIRYVNSSPAPKIAPLFDFTSTELTGFVMSLVLTGILGFYLVLYSPPSKDQNKNDDEPIRTAVFLYKPPPTPKPPPPPKQEKTEILVVKEQKKAIEKPQTNAKIGKAAEARPKPEKRKRPKIITSVKQGGALKTGEHEGANMKSVPKKDVTKTGLLGVFGSKGAQSQLDKAYSGPGELQGLANEASGYAGQNNNRPGDDLGSSIKDTGAGGKGTATIGIAGVGTRGKGFGKAGYGTGGLGEKTGTLVIPGGQDEEFIGQIDREAIRRVVRSHLREVQYCYEKELNHDPNLTGKVIVEWKIGEGGRVVTAEVKSSSIERAAVGTCLVARLKTWKFPDPPANNIPIVTYPFVFQKD